MIRPAAHYRVVRARCGQRTRVGRWRLLTWCSLGAVAWLLTAVGAGWCSSRFEGRLPAPYSATNSSTSSGLQLDLTSDWVSTSGHYTLKIDVLAVPPVTHDRQLTMVVKSVSMLSQKTTSIRFTIDIPAGTLRTRKDVEVPQTAQSYQLEVETYEDGKRCPDLCGAVANSQFKSQSITEAVAAVVWVDSDSERSKVSQTSGELHYDLPDLVSLALFLHPVDAATGGLAADVEGSLSRNDDAKIYAALSRMSTSHLALLPPQALPTNRRAYSSVAIVAMSNTELETVIQHHPAAWQAIRDHVLSGAVLLVSGCPDAPSLARLTQTVSRDPASTGYLSNTWTPLNHESLLIAEKSGRYEADFNRLTGENDTTVNDSTPERVADDDRGDRVMERADALDQFVISAKPRFVRQDFGMGVIVALDTDEIQTVKRIDWIWLLEDLTESRWKWYARHGMSMVRDNPWFWNLVVPGVGLSPILPFIGVISIFVLLIGPVNYFLLNRLHRLYLLLVTVPLGAFLVTASLYAFAFVRDGLGTSLTVRSYTMVTPDQRTISWSRQSYYTGLPPSQGLTYPASSLVLPFDAQPMRVDESRVIEVDEQGQRFVRGYLGTRSHCQMIVGHVQDQPLSVEVQQGPQGQLTVINRTNVRVDGVLVNDATRYYWTDALDVGQSANLVEVDMETARRAVINRFNASETATSLTYFADPQASRNYFYSVDAGEPSPEVKTSVMERQITRILYELRADSARTDRSYVTFTAQAPLSTPLGLTGAQELGSLHVIEGHW